MPVDAVQGGVPAELTAIYDSSLAIVDAAAAEDWDTVAARPTPKWSRRGTPTWRSHDVPPRLTDQMARALDALAGDGLVPAADDHNVEGTQNAGLDTAMAAVDLQLQFAPTTEIDRTRFEVWARQLVADANRVEASPGFVAADVTTLEWVLPRVSPTLDDALRADLEAQLAELRVAADEEDLAAVAELAPQLVATIDQ